MSSSSLYQSLPCPWVVIYLLPPQITYVVLLVFCAIIVDLHFVQVWLTRHFHGTVQRHFRAARPLAFVRRAFPLPPFPLYQHVTCFAMAFYFPHLFPPSTTPTYLLLCLLQPYVYILFSLIPLHLYPILYSPSSAII